MFSVVVIDSASVKTRTDWDVGTGIILDKDGHDRQTRRKDRNKDWVAEQHKFRRVGCSCHYTLDNDRVEIHPHVPESQVLKRRSPGT